MTVFYEAVTKVVDDGLLHQFAEDLVADLHVSGPVDFARLSFFTDSVAPDNHNLYYSRSFSSISLVISFDMSAVPDDPTSVVGMIKPHMAAIFHPGSYNRVYANGSMIIVADRGWSWNPDENRSSEKTFLSLLQSQWRIVYLCESRWSERKFVKPLVDGLCCKI